MILRDGLAVVELEPDRGGLVTRFDVGQRRVLFLDEATLRDPTKNVRGGVPVLFPTPGKLAGDAWAYGGRHGALKQHGFARNLPWRVVDAGTSSATLALEASDATRAGFPWDFTVELTVAVAGTTLRLDHRVTNTGNEPMPFGFGFHPYFFVADADKPRARIATAATRAFDNVTKQEVAVASPIDLTRAEGRPSTPTGWCGRWLAATSCASSRGPAPVTRSTAATACWCWPRASRAPCRWRSTPR